MKSQQLEFPVCPASKPVAEAGWYLAWGYGVKPLVIYAVRGATVWRIGMRQVSITKYAGPIPELR